MHRTSKFLIPTRLLAAGLLAVGLSGPAIAQSTKGAIAAMLEAGPEAQSLSARSGRWTAKITMRASPDATPVVFDHLRADRVMVGAFMEEIISPESSADKPFKRISYLHYNRVEGRWQYVSMDTRFPAGIMPAYSADAGAADHIELQFEPIAFPGWGAAVDGWMLRSNYEVDGIGTDHETARQYWVRADGTGKRWLAVEYDYRRVR